MDIESSKRLVISTLNEDGTTKVQLTRSDGRLLTVGDYPLPIQAQNVTDVLSSAIDRGEIINSMNDINRVIQEHLNRKWPL